MQSTRNDSGPLGVVAVVGALAAFVVVLALTAVAGAQEEPQTQTIGKTKKTPKPSCPKDPCQAIGSVTGFQVAADKQKNLMVAREAGQITSWSVTLSKPKNSQQEFFGEFYEHDELGTAPTARIAVIRPVSSDGGSNENNQQRAAPSYTLKAQGPVTELAEDLGTKATYTLDEPLPIRKGDILAITVPTWIPNFAVDLSRQNVWRASREKGQCENANDIKNGEPHERVDTERVYACAYRQARIIYSAQYTPAA